MTEVIEMLQTEFPDIRMHVVAAQADFVVDALSNLGQEIVLGGVLSLLMILVFLRTGGCRSRSGDSPALGDAGAGLPAAALT
jgi:multidrug efflux pump subunit AcrB